MIKKANVIVCLLAWLLIVGPGCSPAYLPTPTPSVTIQPTIPVPATATPTAAILNANLSQTGWFVYVCQKRDIEDLCLVSPDHQKIIAMGLNKFETISSPTWSPDGRTIAFEVFHRNYVDIYLVDVNCVNTASGCMANIRPITSSRSGWFIHPDWSPDGQKIVYVYRVFVHGSSANQIWTMNADGTNPTRLTDIDGFYPTWSPDGNEIAFVYHESMYGDVFIMNQDGSNIHQLTELLTDSSSPSWSPDGEWLIVESMDDKDTFEPSFIPTLFKVRADGSEVIRLGDGIWAAWSPDGEMIAFSSYASLWFMDANGMNPVKVGEINPLGSICWQPNIITP